MKPVQVISAGQSGRHPTPALPALFQSQRSALRENKRALDWNEHTSEISNRFLIPGQHCLKYVYMSPYTADATFRWAQVFYVLWGTQRPCPMENPWDYLKPALQRWRNAGSVQPHKAGNLQQQSDSFHFYAPVPSPPQEKHKLLQEEK